MEALAFGAANLAWRAGGAAAELRFRRALASPRRAQERKLQRLLLVNAASEYGRRFNFAAIGSVQAFQERVPIVTYDDLREDIAAILKGRQGVLTEGRVVMVEKTTGSLGASKYIPYTAALKREFGEAVAAWTADLFRERPGLMCGGAYWSVSPLAAERECTEGGLPIGFDEDADYFGGVARVLLSRLLLTPPELAQVRDIEACRYVTLLFLLRTSRLSLISAWSPSFLSLLFDAMDRHGARLIDDVRYGTLTPPGPIPRELHARMLARLTANTARAGVLSRLFTEEGALPPERVWPHLTLVSCWASATAAMQISELRRRLPRVEIQPKGLLATEGVVTIPLLGHPGAAPALTSHFLEFRDVERPEERPSLVDELEEGRTYSVLLSTGGGFYRYALGDLVRVVGKVAATPLLEFLGREAHTSDLCGEKLYEGRVRAVLESAFADAGLVPQFSLLVPDWGPTPHYRLVLEADDCSSTAALELAGAVESSLREGHHYDYCRRLGQLRAVEALQVRHASEAFLERCASLGERRGSVKPTALRREPGWVEWFLRHEAAFQGRSHSSARNGAEAAITR